MQTFGGRWEERNARNVFSEGAGEERNACVFSEGAGRNGTLATFSEGAGSDA